MSAVPAVLSGTGRKSERLMNFAPPVACSVTSTSEAITIEQSKRFHAASSSPTRYGCRPFSPMILNTISAVKTTVKMTSNTLSRSVQSCGCS